MRHIFTIGYVAGTMASLALMWLASCAASHTPPQQVDVGTYETLQLACVATSATKEEAIACRNAIKAKWGRLDGGNDGVSN